MIDDIHKIIFVHIPRTSGTSIESFMKDHMSRYEGIQKHSNASQLYQSIGKKKWNSYFKYRGCSLVTFIYQHSSCFNWHTIFNSFLYLI